MNFGPPVSLGGKLADICLIQIITYSGRHTKNIGNLVMRLAGFAHTDTQNHRKNSEKFLKNVENKNLLKIKRILITEIQAYRGAHFLHFACQGEGRAPLKSHSTFMKSHSMTSSCLFNRGATFSQTVTYNNNVFLPADTKSIVQTHTFCITLAN